MQLFLKHALGPHCFWRSVRMALLVGTVLAAINHYDSLMYHTMTSVQWWQVGLTYLVPFSVALYSGGMHGRDVDKTTLDITDE